MPRQEALIAFEYKNKKYTIDSRVCTDYLSIVLPDGTILSVKEWCYDTEPPTPIEIIEAPIPLMGSAERIAKALNTFVAQLVE